MSSTDRVWATATALWDSDVDMILSNLYNQGQLNQHAEQVAAYIKSNSIFLTPDSANRAKDLVKAFNQEVYSAQQQGHPEPHPLLLDHESSMLFRLGISDIHEAANVIPEFDQRWSHCQEPLDALLKNISQIAASSAMGDAQ